MEDEAGPSAGEKRKREPHERSGQVQSLVRALRLLSAVSRADQGITLTEAARRAALPVSSAHRLLSTLQQERFVRFDHERTLWFVGVEAFIAGNGFLRTRDLVTVARPYMRNLMEESGETVNLAVQDEGQAIYLAQVECRQLMRALASPGQRVSLHSSAVGKALIAFANPVRRDALIERVEFSRVTERTIAGRQQFQRAMDLTLQQGFATDDEEHAIGLRCVAAPIHDESRDVIAAISLSGPLARMPDRRFRELGDLVRRSAASVTRAFGGQPPD